MKKTMLIFSLLISSSTAFADLSNRGRLDYEHGEYEWVIPALVLVGLGGFFAYFFLKDFWRKNKDEIFATLGVIFQGGLILLAIYGAYHFVVPAISGKSNHTDETSDISATQTTDKPRQLPPGFRPVTPDDFTNNNSSSNTNTDSWSGYPPIITDGRQMSNKDNDFLVAAILNPTYNLHDYYRALDLTPQNTQFLSFDRYCRSKFIREKYSPSEFRKVYDNVARAWSIFCNLQGANFNDPEIIKYMLEYSPYDSSKPRIEDASNPQLIRNLKVKPLYCTETSSTPKLGIL